MGIFRRRKNEWIEDVIEGETGISSDLIDGSMAGEIVYRETFPTDTEFAKDETAELAAEESAGVTENTPYHNTAKYKMVDPNDDDSTVNTHSS